MKIVENNENAEISLPIDLSSEDATDAIEEEIQDSIVSLLYGTRLRELVKEIASDEGVSIQFGKKGINGMQNGMKFLTVMLTYEILQIIKEKGRVIITASIINEALNSMVGKADSLNIAMLELDVLKNKLMLVNNNTSVLKATDFVNLYGKEEMENTKN